MPEWLLANHFFLLGGFPSGKNVLRCSSNTLGMKSSNISYFRVQNYGQFISIFLRLQLALNLKFHLVNVK